MELTATDLDPAESLKDIQRLIECMPFGRVMALMFASRPGWTYRMVAERFEWAPERVLSEIRLGLFSLGSARSR